MAKIFNVSKVFNVSTRQGNGIMRKAQNAFVNYAVASSAKKTAVKDTLIPGCIAYAITVPSIAAITGFVKGSVVSGGLGILFGSWMVKGKKLCQAFKTKKKASQELKDIIKNENFMDIINRYLRIHNKNMTVTSKDVLNRIKKSKIVIIDNTQNMEVLDKMGFEMPLNYSNNYINLKTAKKQF